MARKTALRKYLDAHEVTQQELADRISEIRGWTVWQTQVSRWANGIFRPSREMRAHIAKATKGAVPVDAW